MGSLFLTTTKRKPFNESYVVKKYLDIDLMIKLRNNPLHVLDSHILNCKETHTLLNVHHCGQTSEFQMICQVGASLFKVKCMSFVTFHNIRPEIKGLMFGLISMICQRIHSSIDCHFITIFMIYTNVHFGIKFDWISKLKNLF